MDQQQNRARNYKRLLIIIVSLIVLQICFADEIKFFYSPQTLMQNNILTLKVQTTTASSNMNLDLEIPDSKNILQEIQSKQAVIGNSITIEKQYKITTHTANKYLFTPLLTNANGKTKSLESFSITVLAPLLSKNTQFFWKAYDIHNLRQEKIDFRQGESVLLQLCGNYSTKQGSDHIYAINIKPVKNATLKKGHDYNFSTGNLERETIIAEFIWIPVFHGKLELPIADILIKHKSYNYIITSVKKKVQVQEKLQIFSKQKDYSYELEKSFTPPDNTDIHYKHKSSFAKNIITAQKILSLRAQEKKSFYNPNIKYQRKKLEKKLGFSKSFKVSSKINFQIFTLITIFLIFIMLIHFIIQKKSKQTKFSIYIFIIRICIFLTIFFNIYFFVATQKKYGICLKAQPLNALFAVPEKTNNIIDNLKLGETVLIKRTNREWYFIQRYDGTKAWIQKNSLVIIE